jgi:hypothetical protein
MAQTSLLEDWDASSADWGAFVVAVMVTNKRTTMDNCKKTKLVGIIMIFYFLKKWEKMMYEAMRN